MARLKEIAEKVFPSALTSYIRNPILFSKNITHSRGRRSRGKYCFEYWERSSMKR
jgi:hypothetical protein